MADLRFKFLGGMIGTAVGDAIGELAFSHVTKPSLRTRIAQATRLVYTDDTAMAMGLAESLIQCGSIDAQHLGNTFRENYQREPWRGYASGPPTVFSLVEKQRIDYVDAARRLFEGDGSYGNGAAMRIAPVGLFYHDAANLYEQARRSAIVTHAHPVGIDGAAILARAIAWVVPLDPRESFQPQDFLRDLIAFARTETMREMLELTQRMLFSNTESWMAGMRLGQGVAAHESVPFAIYAFLRHSQSFEDCLFCAAFNSGDRDTVGAMACAIAGAYLGITGIPEQWRKSLENRRKIEDLAFELWDRRVAQSDITNPGG